jgi:hypothetical protein
VENSRCNDFAVKPESREKAKSIERECWQDGSACGGVATEKEGGEQIKSRFVDVGVVIRKEGCSSDIATGVEQLVVVGSRRREVANVTREKKSRTATASETCQPYNGISSLNAVRARLLLVQPADDGCASCGER